MRNLNKSIKQFDIQNVSFSEILLVILFILLIFNYQSLDKLNLKEKAYEELYQENLKLEEQIKQKNKEILKLSKKNKELEKENELLRALADPTKFKELKDKIKGLEGQITNLKRQITKLKGESEGDGLIHPNCSESLDLPYFIFNIIADPLGYRITALWDNKIHKEIIDKVDGLAEMASKNYLSRKEFLRVSKKIKSWSVNQKPQCRFISKFDDRKIKSNSGEIYKKQIELAQYAFYLKVRD